MRNYLKRSKTSALLAMMMMILFMVSCKKDEGELAEPKALEANLFESAGLYASALKDRNSEHVFEITDITRKDATLHVKVKGGGQEDSFKFIWDGSILLSYPMRIMLVLQYDNHRNDFDKDKEFILTLNLEKIIGTAGTPEEFYFSVLNGSQIQQKNLNPDGNVSSNE